MGTHLTASHHLQVKGRYGSSTWRVESDEAAAVEGLVAVARCQIVAVANPALPQTKKSNLDKFPLSWRLCALLQGL